MRMQLRNSSASAVKDDVRSTLCTLDEWTQLLDKHHVLRVC